MQRKRISIIRIRYTKGFGGKKRSSTGRNSRLQLQVFFIFAMWM